MNTSNKRLVTVLVAIFSFLFLICCCCTLILAVVPNSDEEESADTASEVGDQDVLGESIEVVGNSEVTEYIVKEIVDGDTVRIDYDEDRESVRLLAMDTPEIDSNDCYAQEAKQALSDLVLEKKVRVEYDSKQGERDQYGRLLMYLWVDNVQGEKIFVNEYLVREGFAKAYKDIDSDQMESFIELEKLANEKGKGLWTACSCADKVDQEFSRSCSECNKATVEFYNADCSTRQEVVDDSTCVAACPKAAAPASKPTSKYVCACSKTCPEMSSCEEAYFQLNNCGCSARDRDKDGIPCESLC